MNIPIYLQEMVDQKYEEGMLRQIILRTPSKQMWDGLSVEQQTKWREVISELGADPESYLNHMRRMLPESVK